MHGGLHQAPNIRMMLEKKLAENLHQGCFCTIILLHTTILVTIVSFYQTKRIALTPLQQRGFLIALGRGTKTTPEHYTHEICHPYSKSTFAGICSTCRGLSRLQPPLLPDLVFIFTHEKPFIWIENVPMRVHGNRRVEHRFYLSSTHASIDTTFKHGSFS